MRVQLLSTQWANNKKFFSDDKIFPVAQW